MYRQGRGTTDPDNEGRKLAIFNPKYKGLIFIDAHRVYDSHLAGNHLMVGLPDDSLGRWPIRDGEHTSLSSITTFFRIFNQIILYLLLLVDVDRGQLGRPSRHDRPMEIPLDQRLQLPHALLQGHLQEPNQDQRCCLLNRRYISNNIIAQVFICLSLDERLTPYIFFEID